MVGSNRKQLTMSFRQSIANSISPAAVSRQKDNDVDARGWEQTVPGPLDPLRASELLHGAEPAYERFALTMPMGLPAK
jgi:hypothetical protein